MSSYLATPQADTADLRALFVPVFDKIAEGNVERERNRVFPHDQVQWLIDAKLGAVRIPRSLGGFGASLEQTFGLLAELAAADPNVAHVWRNHLAFVEDRLNAPQSPGNDEWIRRFLDGEFVGGGWTEAGHGTLANLKTRLTDHGDHWQVTGAKFYATGSLFADWLDVLGAGPDGQLLTALVRADQPGVALVDDWTGFGQQTTASGSATYTDARVENAHIYPAGERFSYQGLFYQTALLSVLTGITRATLRDGIAALNDRKRNYPHGLDPVPNKDPQLLAVIGKVSALAYGAESALLRAAAAQDGVAAAHAAGNEEAEKQALLDATVATTHAQLVVIEAALSATTDVFEALGASATFAGPLLDRHWRNARTLASHNPRVYKERILGEYLVHGADPTTVFAISGRGGQGN